MGNESNSKNDFVKNSVLSNQDLMSIMESALFTFDRPMSMRDFCRLFHIEKVSTSTIKKVLLSLAKKYELATSGLKLQETAGGWQIRTKEENKDYIRRLIKGRVFQLSAPALEVLAFVAYQQPCRKVDIDDVRGVESGHLLKTLMEKGLVGFGPKSSLPGRSITYKTTSRFLEIFGLKTIKDLPSLEDTKDLLLTESESSSVLKKLPTQKTINHLKQEQQNTASELKYVSEKIRSVSISNPIIKNSTPQDSTTQKEP